ncbi:MAG: hypothetical protein C5B47_03910, partial [Verrucomicrobia bacterium]
CEPRPAHGTRGIRHNAEPKTGSSTSSNSRYFGSWMPSKSEKEGAFGALVSASSNRAKLAIGFTLGPRNVEQLGRKCVELRVLAPITLQSGGEIHQAAINQEPSVQFRVLPPDVCSYCSLADRLVARIRLTEFQGTPNTYCGYTCKRICDLAGITAESFAQQKPHYPRQGPHDCSPAVNGCGKGRLHRAQIGPDRICLTVEERSLPTATACACFRFLFSTDFQTIVFDRHPVTRNKDCWFSSNLHRPSAANRVAPSVMHREQSVCILR